MCRVGNQERTQPLVLVLECEGPRARSWNAQGQEKVDIPLKKRELNHPSFFFLPFRSIWALGGWNDEAGESGFSLFCLLIQMLISFRGTLRDMPRNKVFPAIRAFLCPVKSTHKINHHNILNLLCNVLNYFKIIQTVRWCRKIRKHRWAKRKINLNSPQLQSQLLDIHALIKKIHMSPSYSSTIFILL